MKTKAIRLPEQMLEAVEWTRDREGSEIAHALRRLVRLGLERDLAERYRRGEISLREAAGLLGQPAREVLEVFWDQGVEGNVTADQTLAALKLGNALAHRARRRRTVPRRSPKAPSRRKIEVGG